MNIYSDDTIFIFGHGPGEEKNYGKKEDLKEMNVYLNKLQEFTEKEMKAGKSKEEFEKSTSIPDVKNRTELWPGALKHNLSQAYKFVAEKS